MELNRGEWCEKVLNVRKETRPCPNFWEYVFLVSHKTSQCAENEAVDGKVFKFLYQPTVRRRDGVVRNRIFVRSVSVDVAVSYVDILSILSNKIMMFILYDE